VRAGAALALAALLAVLLGGCASTSSQPSGDESEAERRSGIYLDLGVAYLRQGQPRKALRTLKKARNLDDGNARVYNALALTYQALGFDDKAQTAFEEAIDRDADDPQVLNNFGVFLAKMGSYARARKQFEKALADPLYNTPETAYYNLGWLARRQGDADQAEGMLRTALRLRADYPQARLALARLMRNEGELAKARKQLDAILKRHAEHVPAHQLAGEVALARGNEASAQHHFQEVVRLAPDGDAAAQAQDMLQRLDAGQENQ